VALTGPAPPLDQSPPQIPRTPEAVPALRPTRRAHPDRRRLLKLQALVRPDPKISPRLDAPVTLSVGVAMKAALHLIQLLAVVCLFGSVWRRQIGGIRTC
jgi:hypothetical protein